MAPEILRLLARNQCKLISPISPAAQRTRVSLKDWAILHAVIEHGGFSLAAERLHCSRSSVSYAVSKIQEQLGVPLLKISGRKAQITPEGSQILKRSRVLVREALALEAYARNLYNGGAIEVRLGIDGSFPAPLLMQALAQFSSQHKNIKVTLIEGESHDIELQLAARTLDLGISCNVPPGSTSKPLYAIDYVEVAHPSHPIFRNNMRGDESSESLIEVEVLSLAPQLEKIHRRKPARTWHVNDIETALAAINHGMGYAWLPSHRVSDLIAKGRLQAVSDQWLNHYRQTVHLVFSRPVVTDAEPTLLAEAIQTVVANSTISELSRKVD